MSFPPRPPIIQMPPMPPMMPNPYGYRKYIFNSVLFIKKKSNLFL